MGLSEQFDKDIAGRFNFDLFSPATQEKLRFAQDTLIRELELDARNAIDGIVQAGIAQGLSAEDILYDIREVIGLNERLVAAVNNYRTMLENLDRGALARQLRNVEMDAVVAAAIDAGEDLAQAAIDQLVSDYADRALTYRARMIAQTESVRYANVGMQDAYAQAIDRGALPHDAVMQHWKVAMDEKTCPVCLSIPDLNPDGQPIGQKFSSIGGLQTAPPDPHPNCRCSLEIITDLDKVPDDSLGL